VTGPEQKDNDEWRKMIDEEFRIHHSEFMIAFQPPGQPDAMRSSLGGFLIQEVLRITESLITLRLKANGSK